MYSVGALFYAKYKNGMYWLVLSVLCLYWHVSACNILSPGSMYWLVTVRTENVFAYICMYWHQLTHHILCSVLGMHL